MRTVARGFALVLLVVVGYIAVTFGQVWQASRHDGARVAEAIIVLGAAQYDGRPSPVLRARLDHAVELYEEDLAPVVVVTGGSRPGDRFTEATAGATYLRERGVPEDAIRREVDGRSTWESLAATSRFLRAEGIEEVLLITDPPHAFRTRAIAADLGLRPSVSPTLSSARSRATLRSLARETAAVALGRLLGYRRLTGIGQPLQARADLALNQGGGYGPGPARWSPAPAVPEEVRMHGHEEHICALRDGSEVLIRPIRPDDKDRLRAGFAKLSAHSRYLRFHASIQELTDEQIRYLTEIDYHDHMAWVAVDREDGDHPGMGVARYIRLPAEPNVAEAAVTVIDRYQGQGLGTLLLGFLARSAIENDIEIFRNYVLIENVGMLELFDQLGAEKQLEEPGVYRVDMPLSKDREDLPDTPAGRVFREAGRKTLPPFGLSFPLSWFRRVSGFPELRLGAGSPVAGREAPMLRTHLDQVLEEDGTAGTESEGEGDLSDEPADADGPARD